MSSKLLRWSAFAALCLCSLAGQFVSAQQFITPVDVKINSTIFPSKAFSEILGVADFDGDGRKDILGVYTPATGPKQYAVLLGKSDGSFTPELTGISVGKSGDTVQVADVDVDGRQDIVIVTKATAPSSSSLLWVYLGNGDGTFRGVPPVSVPGTAATLDLVTDLDKDGKPDLIISSTVWKNLGAGTFKAAFTLPVSGSLIAHGDFNGDGFTDVALETAGGLQILLNNQGTSFTVGATYFILGLAGAAGDLNHDGKLDLVVVDGGRPLQFFPQPKGQILLGKGDGTFSIGTTFSTAPTGVTFTGSLDITPTWVSIADVNGDGLPDVSVGIFVQTHPELEVGQFSDVQVFPGKGDGTVGYPSVFDIGKESQTSLVALNDDGKDGKFELLVFGGPLGGYAVAGNDGKGIIRAPRKNMVYSPSSIVTADFNKDGKDDVAIVSHGVGIPVNPGPASVWVYLGSGKGYFSSVKSYPIAFNSGNIAAGDLNGDGIVDLVVTRAVPFCVLCAGSSFPDLIVLLGNGDGSFKPPMYFSVLGQAAFGSKDNFALLADVNHDGKLDLIGDWGVALGNGDGTFAPHIPLPPEIALVQQMAAGDFNGDGVLDLVVGTRLPGIFTITGYILLGDGKGGFTVKGQQQLGFSTIAVADINKDGKADLIFDSFVQLSNGDGTFAAPVNYPPNLSGFVRQILVADFNRDGNPDVLLLGHAGRGTLTLLSGIGGGKFSATPQYYPTALEQGVVLNLNRDSAPDVVGTTITGITRVLNTGSRAKVTM